MNMQIGCKKWATTHCRLMSHSCIAYILIDSRYTYHVHFYFSFSFFHLVRIPPPPLVQSVLMIHVVVLQAPAAMPAPSLETWCIYVQRQFNTLIVLVAKVGLQSNHSLLTQLVGQDICVYIACASFVENFGLLYIGRK